MDTTGLSDAMSAAPMVAGTASSINAAPIVAGTAGSINAAPTVAGTASSINAAPTVAGTASSINAAPTVAGTASSINAAPKVAGTASSTNAAPAGTAAIATPTSTPMATGSGPAANAGFSQGGGMMAGKTQFAGQLAAAGSKAAAPSFVSGPAGMSTVQAGGVKAMGAGVSAKAFLALGLIPMGAIFGGVWLVSRRKPKPVKRRMIRKLGRKNFMQRLFGGKASLLALLILSAVLVVVAGVATYRNLRTYDVVIAAGGEKAESFVVLKALQGVVAKYYPHIRITVRSTGGTTESLNYLEKGSAQLAAAQADIPTPSNARSVAVMFEDTFQLLARTGPDTAPAAKTPGGGAKQAAIGATINRFADLKGKTIALAKTGAQFQSFLNVADHFGLKEADFTFVGGNDESAEEAFAKGEATALFHVRALHNAAITKLVAAGGVNFVPIDDAAAMRMDMPAYLDTVIPKGAYRGDPPVPAANLPTVRVQRILVASNDADPEVVRAITETLMDRRQDLAAAIPNDSSAVRPILAQIAEPAVRTGIIASLHPGAADYYTRDQSSFVGRHADLIFLACFALVLGGLWFSELRHSSTIGQKNHADAMNRKLVLIMDEIKAAEFEAELPAIDAKLMNMMAEAVVDLDKNRLSERSFQSFQMVWQIASHLLRDRGQYFADKARELREMSGYSVTPAEIRSPHASLAKMLESGRAKN